MKALLIKTEGTESEIAPADGSVFTLDELQGYVGGYIEAHRLLDGRWMILNEEGWDLPPNEIATVMAPHLVTGGKGITGDVVVCDASMLD